MASDPMQRIDEIEEEIRLRNIGRYLLAQTLETTASNPERRFIMVYDGVVYGYTVERGVAANFGEEERVIEEERRIIDAQLRGELSPDFVTSRRALEVWRKMRQIAREDDRG